MRKPSSVTLVDQFVERRTLKKHMRNHACEKSYKCDTCGSQFAENGKLKRHMSTHTGEKTEKCGTCGSQFA